MDNIYANEEIYGHTVILIDETGHLKGEVVKKMAIAKAREQGMDLVQVAKNEKGLAICKFADVGKVRYHLSKKKVYQKPTETKEMSIHLNTQDHDIEVKKNKVRNMLNKHCLVRFAVELKGRERAFVNVAKEKLNSIVSSLADIARADELKVAENLVFVVLRPIKGHSSSDKKHE